jgi:hypothetical protein
MPFMAATLGGRLGSGLRVEATLVAGFFSGFVCFADGFFATGFLGVVFFFVLMIFSPLHLLTRYI